MSYVKDYRTATLDVSQATCGGYTNLQTGLDLSNYTDTSSIVSIELMDLRYRPDPAEVATEIDVLRLQWYDYMPNSNGTNYVLIMPQRLADGTYFAEYSTPINLYQHKSNSYRDHRTSFRLMFYKTFNETSLRTATYQARFRVTRLHTDSLTVLSQFEPKILAAQ